MKENNTSSFREQLQALLQTFEELLVAKNADYSGNNETDPFANFKFTSEALGLEPEDSIFYEIAKKYKRAANLFSAKVNAVESESFEDAIKDIVGSSLLMLLYLRSKQ